MRCLWVFILLLTSKVIPGQVADIQFYSQKGQDAWVITEVFHYKTNGYFIDLAASDGKHLSNTYALEKHLNWTGICIEPNPFFYEKLITNRQCVTLPVCVDYTNHKVLFRIDNGLLGGIIADDTDNNYAIRKKAIQRAKRKRGILTLQTKTLQQILEENNAPHIIDYLSLDVEGAETRILREFPFEKYIFLAMTIERPSPELNALLFQNGYVFVKNYKYDSFYVHKTIANLKNIEKTEFEQIPRKQ